ncbi:hypothetical protein [Haloarcula brevis]|uniref:hypothetical protein n=1 Tax=Haloarcula brevis TaxID=3111453 RepID=UPI00300F34D4
MTYASAVVRSARLTVRNPFAVLLVSVGVTVSLLPFVTGILVAGGAGALIGLWTSSFLLGFVWAAGARLMTVILEREVSLGTDYFWAGLREAKYVGPVVGIGTFLASALAITLLSIPGGDVLTLSLGLVGVYVLIGWFVLVTYALTLWAALENPREVRSAFGDAITLILEEPVAAGWLVVQSAGWTLLAIPLIIAPVLVLPGFVQLVGTEIVRIAATESEGHEPIGSSDDTSGEETT